MLNYLWTHLRKTSCQRSLLGFIKVGNISAAHFYDPEWTPRRISLSKWRRIVISTFNKTIQIYFADSRRLSGSRFGFTSAEGQLNDVKSWTFTIKSSDLQSVKLHTSEWRFILMRKIYINLHFKISPKQRMCLKSDTATAYKRNKYPNHDRFLAEQTKFSFILSFYGRAGGGLATRNLTLLRCRNLQQSKSVSFGFPTRETMYSQPPTPGVCWERTYNHCTTIH